jgi:NTP pyrophosphatase (non-canonical NTP hydrolase)
MATLQNQPTLADLQTYIETVCRERGWDKRPITEKMLFLTEEVGEVARAIRKELQIAQVEPKPATPEHLGEELVDVLNYVLDIANEYDIDMEAAFRAKWSKNASRTWAEPKKAA